MKGKLLYAKGNMVFYTHTDDNSVIPCIVLKDCYAHHRTVLLEEAWDYTSGEKKCTPKFHAKRDRVWWSSKSAEVAMNLRREVNGLKAGDEIEAFAGQEI